MPIITVQVIKGVVLTSPEQKRELLQKMTDAFISVVGEVARPYTYVVIQETEPMEWSIGGRPLPDLPFLYGPEYAAMHTKANQIMRSFVEGSSASAGAAAKATPARTHDPKAVIRRWNEEAWSSGKYDLAHEIIAPVMTVHGAGGQPIGMGPQGLIDLIKAWRTAFPYGYMSIDDIIVEGELVAIRNTWHGAQSDTFYGVPPSGKFVGVTSIGIDRVVNGQVTEGWGELDMLGMMQTLGAMPKIGHGNVAQGKSSLWGETQSKPGTAHGSAADNKAVLKRFIEAAARGDGAGAVKCVDVKNFADHNPVWGGATLEDALAVYNAFRAAMPDLHIEVESDIMISEGDQVVAHSIVTGTHTGAPIFGVMPSGKSLKWTHSDWARVVDGKIVERWVSADVMTFFQQLGALG